MHRPKLHHCAHEMQRKSQNEQLIPYPRALEHLTRGINSRVQYCTLVSTINPAPQKITECLDQCLEVFPSYKGFSIKYGLGSARACQNWCQNCHRVHILRLRVLDFDPSPRMMIILCAKYGADYGTLHACKKPQQHDA